MRERKRKKERYVVNEKIREKGMQRKRGERVRGWDRESGDQAD